MLTWGKLCYIPSSGTRLSPPSTRTACCCLIKSVAQGGLLCFLLRERPPWYSALLLWCPEPLHRTQPSGLSRQLLYFPQMFALTACPWTGLFHSLFWEAEYCTCSTFHRMLIPHFVTELHAASFIYHSPWLEAGKKGWVWENHGLALPVK